VLLNTSLAAQAIFHHHLYTSSSGRSVGCISILPKQHLNTHRQQLRALGLFAAPLFHACSKKSALPSLQAAVSLTWLCAWPHLPADHEQVDGWYREMLQSSPHAAVCRAVTAAALHSVRSATNSVAGTTAHNGSSPLSQRLKGSRAGSATGCAAGGAAGGVGLQAQGSARAPTAPPSVASGYSLGSGAPSSEYMTSAGSQQLAATSLCVRRWR
jgi:hypothetical protein